MVRRRKLWFWAPPDNFVFIYPVHDKYSINQFFFAPSRVLKKICDVNFLGSKQNKFPKRLRLTVWGYMTG